MGIMARKRIILPLLIVGFVLFSLAPTFYELSHARFLRPDRQFELVHNFPTDYNFYLSRIREGLEGRWTVLEKYTSEPHSGSFIHELYLLMGQVGRFVRVPAHRAGDIYHMARIVLAVALLWMIVAFSQKSFEHTRSRYVFGASLLGFLFAVTASSWPKLVEVAGVWRFGGYMAWWSVMDSLQRITFIPHLLAGQAFMIFLIISLTARPVMKPGMRTLLLGGFAFVLGMIFPPGLLFVYVVMGIHALMSGTRFRAYVMPYGIVVMLSAASLVYLMLMTGIYPWKRLAEVDIIRPLPFDYAEYVRALGPMLPLGIIGTIMVLVGRESALFPAVSWIFAWIALLGIFAFVPQQSPLRFSEMIPHVPLGVLSAYVMLKLYAARPFRPLAVLVTLLLVTTGLFHMYSSYLWQRDFVDHKIRATLPLVPTGSFVMYPLKDFIAAMGFIRDQTHGQGVILSETTAGNYIPALTGNFVYAGHDNTVAFEMKKEKVKAFFSGSMHPDEAKKWIQSMPAQYIFFGPQEREDGGLRDLRVAYPYVTEVYKNNQVTIYALPPWR